ncbi:MAG TPA: universal stress protein [Vicinamibacterales bacterium]|nr:universal stress protein [Vicinamibacterales bacterium]
MYKSIYVPVDNSDHSNRAIACAVGLGRAFSAKLVGCHVYAAKLHDYRFRQMEYTLPEEYIDEVELERQRKIHDSLITMGLKLISDSYLDGMSRLCGASGLAFEPRMMDGKHHTEILRDLAGSQHDLVVIGALGIGRARDSVIGSVCERVARQSDRDVWVVKHVPEADEPERGTILVGIDGSPQSFGALMTAIDLARSFGKQVEAIAVYDPYLHYSVFNGIVNVLTEQAAKVFRFEEQNQLHEEIIDTGLAQIYQSHLEVGERMAGEAGIAVKKTLLDGKPFQKILDHARKTNPWLIVLGRIGVHSPKEETGLGSNAENVLRAAPCDVLLSTRLELPRLDVRAEETVRWTPEAEARMTHVPEQVKGIARTGVLRLALEKGHSVITSAVIDEAMDRFMPKSASAATKALAEAVALERAKAGPVSMCRSCGVAATQSDPVRCTVCGASDFEVISPEMIEKIAAVEGGLQEETTYDGRKLRWSEEARKGLWTMKNAYQRRRVKARVEKRARMMRLDAITLDFARQVIEEETGTPLDIRTPSPGVSGARAAHASGGGNGAADQARLVARDDKKNPLISSFDWTDDAAQRILRVPAGFMRNQTQERIEDLARERAVTAIDLALVEDGIEIGKKMMAEMIATYSAPGASPGAAAAGRDAAAASAAPAGSGSSGGGYLNEVSPLNARSASGE